MNWHKTNRMNNVLRLIVGLALLDVSVAEACIVDPRDLVRRDVDGTYSSSDVIFIGEVVGTEVIDTSWIRVIFAVEEQLKGNVAEQEALALFTGSICTPQVDLGSSFLVFGHNRPNEVPAAAAYLRGLLAPEGQWDGRYVLYATLGAGGTIGAAVLLELRELGAGDRQ